MEGKAEGNFPVAVTDDYALYVNSPAQGVLLVHCDVYNWSKDKYQEFLSHWVDIVSKFEKSTYNKLYCLIPREHEKIGKFAVMFGFEPVGAYEYTTDTGDTGVLVKYEFPLKEAA